MPETNEKPDMAGFVADEIGTETERLNRLADSGQQATAEGVNRFSLPVFREAFAQTGGKILPPELKDRFLEGLKKELYKMKLRYPQGAELLPAAFPCDHNGRIYSGEEMASGEYFHVLMVDPKTGMSTGYGGWPGTYAAMLPEEIAGQCKFTVDYPSGEPEADEDDFRKFSEDFSAKYEKLRELLS